MNVLTGLPPVLVGATVEPVRTGRRSSEQDYGTLVYVCFD